MVGGAGFEAGLRRYPDPALTYAGPFIAFLGRNISLLYGRTDAGVPLLKSRK